jgi:hypothetical protein
MAKVAVSIPDDLNEWADHEAKQRGITRSALHAEALRRLRGKPYNNDLARTTAAAAEALQKQGAAYAESIVKFAQQNASSMDLGG